MARLRIVTWNCGMALARKAPSSALSLLAICALVYFHQARTAALVAITMLGAGVLDLALKHSFHRARFRERS